MSLYRTRRRCWRYWVREWAWAFVTVACLLAFAWAMGWILGRPWVGVNIPMKDALRPDLLHARSAR